MILTQEFLTAVQVCPEGQVVAEMGNYIGMDYDDVIKDLVRRGLNDDAGWMIAAKKTELYVRTNGSIITMGAYQVFNPLTGVHTKYETEAEARAALIELAKQVIAHNNLGIVQEIANENGDTTWIPTEIHKTLVIS